MTERYSRAQIEQEIHILEKHRWGTAPNAIRQLLADRDNLVAHIKAIEYCVFSDGSEFTRESLKALIEKVDK